MTQNAAKLTKNQEIETSSEKGSIIVWIFVFIALFAALTFTVSQGTRSGTQNISREQAQLAATEILDYASAIKRVVQELQINGCSDTEISFENSVISGYSNPNSSPDNSCHVFHPNGGGIQYINFNSEYWVDSSLGYTWAGQSGFSGIDEVNSIGTTCGAAQCSDLLMYVYTIKKDVCLEINNKLDIENPAENPPIDSEINASEFEGAYGYSHTLGDEASSSALDGKSVGCFFENDTHPEYHFYQVLIPR
jgi:hypothetical protein